MTTSSPSSSSLLGLIVGGRYRLARYIASGSFGAVYLGVDIMNGEEVAVKLESREFQYKEYELLLNERVILDEILHGGKGVPSFRWYGRERDYDILVMELLGPSLGDLFRLCSSRFTIKTVLMLANQMLDRLEYIHKNDLIHRDLKLDNFLIGTGKQCNQLYLADFGLAKQYRDIDTLRHNPCQDTGLCGTALYASINAHSKEQSRRDDMESLGYILMHMIRGNLPWQGLQALPRPQKYERIREKKMSTSVERLCKGYPPEFAMYLHYCRGLRYKETPDYKYLRWLFHKLFSRKNYKYDNIFDWTLLNQKPIASITEGNSETKTQNEVDECNIRTETQNEEEECNSVIESEMKQEERHSETESEIESDTTNIAIRDDDSSATLTKAKHPGQLCGINTEMCGPSTILSFRPKSWNLKSTASISKGNFQTEAEMELNESNSTDETKIGQEECNSETEEEPNLRKECNCENEYPNEPETTNATIQSVVSTIPPRSAIIIYVLSPHDATVRTIKN